MLISTSYILVYFTIKSKWNVFPVRNSTQRLSRLVSLSRMYTSQRVERFSRLCMDLSRFAMTRY